MLMKTTAPTGPTEKPAVAPLAAILKVCQTNHAIAPWIRYDMIRPRIISDGRRSRLNEIM